MPAGLAEMFNAQQLPYSYCIIWVELGADGLGERAADLW
jgi:hypothetical protein